MGLRSGTLPCGARRVRGRPDMNGTCDCCGPGVIEYLGHIVQVCPRTHGPRIDRHNAVVKKILERLVQMDWTVCLEPRIPTAQSFVKPDLVFWNGDSAFVLDVGINGDGFDPDTGHERKVDYYAAEAVHIRKWINEQATADLFPEFTAFVSNWRGVLSRKSTDSLLALGFSKSDIRLLSIVIVERSSWIHQVFTRSTRRLPGWKA